MKITASDFPAKGNALRADEIVALAWVADDAGVDRLGITDFPFHEECVALMAGCLTVTERLEVESLVTTPFRRPPDVTACAWATLADMSAGRAVLGLGRGGGMAETWVPPFGWKRPRPIEALEEFVAICRAMWAGEEPPFEGQILHTTGRRLEFLPRFAIPVLIAARGPRMLALAGRIADIVHIALPFLGSEYMASNVAIVRDAADKAGRRAGDYEIDLTIALSVSQDRAFARESAKLTAAVGILWIANAEKQVLSDLGFADGRGTPKEFTLGSETVDAIANRWNMWTGEPLPPDIAARIDDETVDQFVVAGTPEECSERLRTIVAGLDGVTGIRFKLPPLSGRESVAQFQEMVRLCGELRPALEGVAAKPT